LGRTFIRVEIQDHNGIPIPGFTLDDCPEIIGDEIERIVSWKNGAARRTQPSHGEAIPMFSIRYSACASMKYLHRSCWMRRTQQWKKFSLSTNSGTHVQKGQLQMTLDPKRRDTVRRAEVTDTTDRRESDMREKSEEIGESVDDVEAVRSTLDSLNLGGTSDAAKPVESQLPCVAAFYQCCHGNLS